MLSAVALAAAVVVAAGGPVRAEPLESLALTALKGVCLGDATMRRDQLAEGLGWTTARVEAEGQISRAAWDRQGEGGHVKIQAVVAKSEYSGSYCTVVVYGDPGAFLQKAKALLTDTQFRTFSPPQRPGLTEAWEMAKSGYDGHHSWVVLGGKRPFAKPPLAPEETSAPLAFVQVTYFYER